MINYLAVFIGGGLGAATRLAASNFFRMLGFHSVFATRSVNVLGGFVLGVLGVYFGFKSSLPHGVKIFLTVGFCGGLTTFSTFSVECLDFVKSAKYHFFVIYSLISLILCLSAAALGAYYANKL